MSDTRLIKTESFFGERGTGRGEEKLVYGEIYQTNINQSQPCLYLGYVVHRAVARHKMVTMVGNSRLRIFSFTSYDKNLDGTVIVKTPIGTPVLRESEARYVTSLLQNKINSRL